MMKTTDSSNPFSLSDRLSRESLRREWRVLAFAWQMAKRYHLALWAAMLIEIGVGLFPSAAVWWFNGALSGAETDILGLVTKENCVRVILILFVYLVLQELASVLTSFAIIEVEYNIRMRYLNKVTGLPLERITKYLDNRSAFGMTQETAMTAGLIPMVYRSFLRAPVTIVSSVVLLAFLSARMLVLVAGLVTIIVAASLLLRTRLKQLHRTRFDATSSLLQYFSDWLSGNRLFRVYGAEAFYEKRVQSAFGQIASSSRKHTLYGAGQSLFVEVLTYIAMIVFVLFLPGANGRVEIGVVLSFPALVLLVRGEIIKFIAGYQQLATTESSVARLQAVLEMDTTPSEGETWTEKVQRIDLQDLTFSYGNGPVLRQASLTLEKGRPYVLTGANGTGKTTTLNLLLGLLVAQEGKVCYNGHDISAFEPASLLAQCAIVEQEPFVFQGTLMDNITLGRPIGEEPVRHALHRLGLDYLAEGEAGLGMPLGNGGRVLSSGEKQRLALVRAFVGEPSVLILDEPTANTDRTTAELIVSVMTGMAHDRVVLCVSHDPLITAHTDFDHYRLENGKYTQYHRL